MARELFDYGANRLGYIKGVIWPGEQAHKTRKRGKKKSSKKSNASRYKDYKARQSAMGIKRANPNNIGVITPKKLSLMTDTQLQTLSESIAKQWAQESTKLINEAKRTPYHAMPAIKPSKQDYMRVKTQPPTDAEIAAAPSKQRRFLRRRQRKFMEAKKRIEQYNIARNQPSMSVYDARIAEINRTAMGEFGTEQIVPTRLSNFLRKKNVLSDKAFVNTLLENNRNVLEKEIMDAAKMVGRKTNKPHNNVIKRARKKLDKKVEIHSKSHQNQYDAFEESILRTMGKKGLRKWRSLSRKQRARLWNEGAIVKTVFSWVDSDPKNGITESFNTPRQRRLARQTFGDYITMATKNY